MRTTIIIVTYNSSSVIGRCLQSIPPSILVYLVDNASTDTTVQIVKETKPDAKIIENRKNIGFGCANNLALLKVQTEFAMLLNPDTVLYNDTILNLENVADTYKDAAIIAPIMFFEDGKPQIMYKNSVFKREKEKKKSNILPEGDICTECLSGAAMLIKVKMFKKIGFFDPKIFLFYEDDDICLKARQQGFALILTPNAKLIHLMGKSSPITNKSIYFKNWHMMWSRLYLEQKYNGKAKANNLAVKELVKQSIKAIGHMLSFNNDKIIKSFARLMAIFYYFMSS